MNRGKSLVSSYDSARALPPYPDMLKLGRNPPDAEECDKDVFFTHGFRVNEPGAHAWGAEAFKRFWQYGSNARFHMFTWAGA